MSSIMRWRNGLMGLSSIAKAPVSHGVQNPMILRQSDASRCPGLQTPHADARRPPRERFSPSTFSGHSGSRRWTSKLVGKGPLKGPALRNHPGNQNTSTSSILLNGRGIKRVWSTEVRYNVNPETRDEDVVLIGEHCPFRRHIG